MLEGLKKIRKKLFIWGNISDICRRAGYVCQHKEGRAGLLVGHQCIYEYTRFRPSGDRSHTANGIYISF